MLCEAIYHSIEEKNLKKYLKEKLRLVNLQKIFK